MSLGLSTDVHWNILRSVSLVIVRFSLHEPHYLLVLISAMIVFF